MGSHESQTPLPSDIESLITQLTGRLATLLVTEHTDAIQKPKRNINLNPESSGDEAKIRLIGLLEHLQRQLYEPTDYLKELTQGRSLDVGTVRALVRLGIPDQVPLSQDISIDSLASKVSITPKALTRLLSYAETLGLFYFTVEDRSRIGHTVFSVGLAKGVYAELGAWDVTVPPAASLELSTALQQFGSCDGPEQAPFKIGMNTTDNFYQWHNKNPKYADLFHKGMASEQEDPRTSPQHIVNTYNWHDFDGKVIIDLGGSNGHVAKSILRAFPKVRIVVQDQEDVIGTAKCIDGTALEFMAHDFFQEQTLVADAYLLRYIFHNWNDVDCGRILKALRPALRQGTKLLVMELVQENHAVSPESWFEDRIVRRRDMQMMSFIGASERSIKDYEELVRNSIPEFKFSGYHRPAGSFVAMLEWTFLGA
nr:O-methyltransferase [Pseudopithomyces chartarum]